MNTPESAIRQTAKLDAEKIAALQAQMAQLAAQLAAAQGISVSKAVRSAVKGDKSEEEKVERAEAAEKALEEQKAQTEIYKSKISQYMRYLDASTAAVDFLTTDLESVKGGAVKAARPWSKYGSPEQMADSLAGVMKTPRKSKTTNEPEPAA